LFEWSGGSAAAAYRLCWLKELLLVIAIIDIIWYIQSFFSESLVLTWYVLSSILGNYLNKLCYYNIDPSIVFINYIEVLTVHALFLSQ